MFLNRRGVRITVGLLLLACGILVLWPSLTGHTSLDGTVNARFVALSSPIEGMVTNTPPKVGTHVGRDRFLITVENSRIDQSRRVDLETEVRRVRARLEALQGQRAVYRRLQEELAGRVDEHRQAAIRDLDAQVAAQESRLAIRRIEVSELQSEHRRKDRLQASGAVTGLDLERARLALAAAQHEAELAVSDLDRLRQQLDTARRGIFVGDGRNDVSYSRQRLDELTLTLSALEAQHAELEAQERKLEEQVEHEEQRIRTFQRSVLWSAFDGVVWRNSVVQGANVVAGDELMRLLNCRELFVDILVPEVNFDEIYPGREAEIRLLGRSDVLRGQVASVRGNAVTVEEPTLAASPPQAPGRMARIRVGLEPSALNTDFDNFCQVGRTVQVRFDTRSFPLKQWLASLWFAIS